MFPYGSGVGFDGFFTGKPRIGGPSVVRSKTYFHFRVDSQLDAKAFVSFLLKSEMANFLVSLRKIDQHISEKTVEYIPMPSSAILQSGGGEDWTAAKERKYRAMVGLTEGESRLVTKHAQIVFSRQYKSHQLSLLSVEPTQEESDESDKREDKEVQVKVKPISKKVTRRRRTKTILPRKKTRRSFFFRF